MIHMKALKKVHFIGIGGIGVSAIARMMLHEGKEVTGSDAAASLITEELQTVGAKVFLGQRAENISDDIDLVVYTIAIQETNPELTAVREKKIPALTYAEALHEISRNKYTIAVAGTHGKTTTTAMLANILLDAAFDPTVVVGSLLKGRESNFVAGKSKYFVVEACEFKKSFLELEPTIGIITNIDNDHLDYYKDLAHIQEAFREFAEKIPKSGFLITDSSHKTIAPVLKGLACTVVDYKKYLDQVPELRVPGEHNRHNAAAALAVADILKIAQDAAQGSLGAFSGTWRRFEYRGKTKTGAYVYDDYGHHPTEVKATLAGAREAYPNSKIVVVFQPHLFSRTKLLLEEFGNSFNDANRVLMLPIYPSREAFDPSINSEMIVQKIGGKAHTVKNVEEAAAEVEKAAAAGDVVITMGAGDVYKMVENIL